MEDLLFVGLRQTLDDICATDIASPDFIKLMDRAETYLDNIKIRYGNQIYEGMNKCYTLLLAIKGDEKECQSGYMVQ